MSAPQLKHTNSTPLMSLEAYAARSSASEGRKGLERTSSFGSSQPSASTSARANHTDLENPFCQNSGRKIRQANQATASTSRATGNTSFQTNSKGKAPMVQGSLSQAPLPSLLSRLSAVGNDPTAAMKQESKAEKRRMSQWQLLRYVGAPFYVPKKLMGREEEFQGISRADETTLRSIADKIREKKENDRPSCFDKEEKAMLQRCAQGDLLGIPNKTFERWLEKNGFTDEPTAVWGTHRVPKKREEQGTSSSSKEDRPRSNKSKAPKTPKPPQTKRVTAPKPLSRAHAVDSGKTETAGAQVVGGNRSCEDVLMSAAGQSSPMSIVHSSPARGPCSMPTIPPARNTAPTIFAAPGFCTPTGTKSQAPPFDTTGSAIKVDITPYSDLVQAETPRRTAAPLTRGSSTMSIDFELPSACPERRLPPPEVPQQPPLFAGNIATSSILQPPFELANPSYQTQPAPILPQQQFQLPVVPSSYHSTLQLAMPTPEWAQQRLSIPQFAFDPLPDHMQHTEPVVPPSTYTTFTPQVEAPSAAPFNATQGLPIHPSPVETSGSIMEVEHQMADATVASPAIEPLPLPQKEPAASATVDEAPASMPAPAPQMELSELGLRKQAPSTNGKLLPPPPMLSQYIPLFPQAPPKIDISQWGKTKKQREAIEKERREKEAKRVVFDPALMILANEALKARMQASSSTSALASSEGREGKGKKRHSKGAPLSRSAPAGSSNDGSMKTRKQRFSSGKMRSDSEQPGASHPAPLVRSNAIADLGGTSTVDTPSRPGVLKRRAQDAFGPLSRALSSNRSAANYLPDEHCDEEENRRAIRRRVGPEWMPGAWVPAGRWEVQDGRVEAKGLDGGRKATKSVRFVDPKQSVLDVVVDELWKGVSSVISWALGN